MEFSRFAVVTGFVAAFAACATVAARIREHQAEFDGYPAQVRRDIRRGQVDAGFTPSQVEMALGRPGRVFRRLKGGISQEVWTYGSVLEPSDDVGLHPADDRFPSYGESVGVDAIPERIDEEGKRVVFQGGKVIAVEKRWLTAMNGEKP